MPTVVSAQTAVSQITSGQRIYVHGMAAAPQPLLRALADRKSELENVEILHLHTEGPAPYAEPGTESAFRTKCLFVGPNLRAAVAAGRADYIPVFLSEVPGLFRRNILPLDAAFIQVSPPDEHGFVSLGVSVDATLAAVQTAKTLIAVINPNMPRTHGDGVIPYNRLDFIVHDDAPLPSHALPAITDIERAIAAHVASLIPNGATLQMGIGAIPNAVLEALENHRELGVHTEMFSDGVVNLFNSGAITNQHKPLDRGRIVSGFVSGTQRLYDFVNDNPIVQLKDISYVNDTTIIRRMPRMTAINSAIEIDLTGQVCADSIGHTLFSGVGGQMDFVRGASLSEGGKPIFALPSTTTKGISRIVPALKPGAGVVTTRAHVHYVATEYGIAELYGKTIEERAQALLKIAHPGHRETLARQWHDRFQ